MSASTYVWAAVADLVFVVTGYLFVRHVVRLDGRAARWQQVVSLVIAPFVYLGIALLVIVLIAIGPGCPPGRWAC
jgi:cytochrome c oxidase assembly factor CtaG